MKWHRSLFVVMLAALAALVSTPGCASDLAPLMGSGGGAAARGGNAEGTTGTIEPVTAYGPVGGATATKLGYQRQETGSQAAPTIAFNLQPAAGATTAASYPNLTSFTPIVIVVMGNSQRDSTLGSDQLEKLARVAEEAGKATMGAIGASGSSTGKAVEKVAEAVAPSPAPTPAPPR